MGSMHLLILRVCTEYISWLSKMAVRQSDYLTRFIKTNEITSSNLIELVSDLDIGLFGKCI